MFLVCASLVSGMMDSGPFYCERMGYTADRDNYECIFDDGNRCNLQKFLIGECGQEYVKELSCVPLGEPVFRNFDKCCEGKPYLPYKFLGQSSCQPFSKRFFGNLRYNPICWVGIAVILIVGYFVYKKYKKWT